MHFSIDNRTDKEVGNVFPQTTFLNQQLAHSIKIDEFSSLKEDLVLILQPKSKLTNILSQAEIPALGILIDNKLKSLLLNFNLMSHQYYKCLVKDLTNSNHEYHWLHLVEDLENINWLDYKKSSFFVKQFGFREGNIEVSSYEDYCNKLTEIGDMGSISIENIKLYENSLDLFTIPYLSRKIFISERLKKALELSNISGFSIEEISS